jgi:hypothetical protein
MAPLKAPHRIDSFFDDVGCLVDERCAGRSARKVRELLGQERLQGAVASAAAEGVDGNAMYGFAQHLVADRTARNEVSRSGGSPAVGPNLTSASQASGLRRVMVTRLRPSLTLTLASSRSFVSCWG